MRCLMKVSIPVERGNAAASDGSLGKTIESILADLKPEAAYFAEDNGKRTAFIFFDLKDPSQIPAVAEPWFLAFDAHLEFASSHEPGRLEERRAGHRTGSQELQWQLTLKGGVENRSQGLEVSKSSIVVKGAKDSLRTRKTTPSVAGAHRCESDARPFALRSNPNSRLHCFSITLAALGMVACSFL